MQPIDSIQYIQWICSIIYMMHAESSTLRAGLIMRQNKQWQDERLEHCVAGVSDCGFTKASSSEAARA